MGPKHNHLFNVFMTKIKCQYNQHIIITQLKQNYFSKSLSRNGKNTHKHTHSHHLAFAVFITHSISLP